ncbi:hypothetical protein GGTG_14308 [Gaeumannomyces tritici R3-111a-1]|uniref:Uncharacterized protein n=1 Tax=Gaeumannomyces tritici (strain R3-111a-1) TaxID=644352 RepID=J3PL61_GAET3|nr:hypothetical protein GGTG_14308 [Gaeumannomyces tritici R3-111a-1]EJT68114.1 hypothetical protein GGTG_14308 [Gaeumannomyces tritici R3-111a-1]
MSRSEGATISAAPRALFHSVGTFIFIYTIILLCSDIPVPEYKTAVVLLLVSYLVNSLILFPLSLIPVPLIGFSAAFASVALSVATLAVVVVRWNLALATADQWAVPHNIDPSLIPEDANPNLWKLVRNKQYGIGVTVGAALDLVGNLLGAIIVCIVQFAYTRD